MCLFASQTFPEVKADVAKRLSKSQPSRASKNTWVRTISPRFTSSADATATQEAMYGVMGPVVEKILASN